MFLHSGFLFRFAGMFNWMGLVMDRVLEIMHEATKDCHPTTGEILDYE